MDEVQGFDGWDLSNYVGCEILKEKCNPIIKTLDRLSKSSTTDGDTTTNITTTATTMIRNVRRNTRHPNVSNETLSQMDQVLKRYDCQHILTLVRNDYPSNRLRIHFPTKLYQLEEECCRQNLQYDPQTASMTKAEMKLQIQQIIRDI